MYLQSNAAIYGREYGDWPFVYRCAECQAYVGLHPDTDLPLGIMASKETIKARKDAKFLFQRLTKERFANNRTAAYAWLAKALGIAPSICHFGMFGHDQADRAADVCRAQLGSRA